MKKLTLEEVIKLKRKNIIGMKISQFNSDEWDKIFEYLHDELGFNTCDKCEELHDIDCLIWIDTEDFKPLEKDKFNEKKYKRALKKCYSALCERCYKKECCD